MKSSATVRFLNKDEGGRITPPLPGYKPQIKLEGVFTSCFITPKDPTLTIMRFGIDLDVFIELQYEDLYLQHIKKGMEVYLYEGSRLIGLGHIAD